MHETVSTALSLHGIPHRHNKHRHHRIIELKNTNMQSLINSIVKLDSFVLFPSRVLIFHEFKVTVGLKVKKPFSADILGLSPSVSSSSVFLTNFSSLIAIFFVLVIPNRFSRSKVSMDVPVDCSRLSRSKFVQASIDVQIGRPIWIQCCHG